VLQMAEKRPAGIPELSEPNWLPLEQIGGDPSRFEHMGRDGTIEIYRSRSTRRWINIDTLTNQCFALEGCYYTPIPTEHVLAYVLGLHSVMAFQFA
jgi:hypothetical protein